MKPNYEILKIEKGKIVSAKRLLDDAVFSLEDRTNHGKIEYIGQVQNDKEDYLFFDTDTKLSLDIVFLELSKEKEIKVSSMSLNIAIDIVGEEKININIHKIVSGVSTETLLMTMDDFGDNGSFEAIWEKVGDKIHKHMKDNPVYDDLGS